MTGKTENCVRLSFDAVNLRISARERLIEGRLIEGLRGGGAWEGGSYNFNTIIRRSHYSSKTLGGGGVGKSLIRGGTLILNFGR